jgi:RNA polymerase sigma-70 factor (ECF subfamily)
MDELMNVGELASEADDELLARYQQDDDEAAFAVIHDRHRDGLLAYARQHLDNVLNADAEDIVQQTFLQFYVNRKRYSPRTGVLALLYKMVGDNCTEHLRSVGAQKRDYSRKRRLYDPNNNTDDDDGCAQNDLVPDPKADPAERERKSLVDELLATLTPKQAEAIRLVRIDGHTAEAAAELLDLPPTTIRKRIKDGINSLRSRASADG